MWQTTAYWFMGAMSNDPAKLAVFTGFCEISLGRQATGMVLMTFYFPQTNASSLLDLLLYGAWMPCKHRKLLIFREVGKDLMVSVLPQIYEHFHFYLGLSCCWHDLRVPFGLQAREGPHGD